jgi:hypothetical protein
MTKALPSLFNTATSLLIAILLQAMSPLGMGVSPVLLARIFCAVLLTSATDLLSRKFLGSPEQETCTRLI